MKITEHIYLVGSGAYGLSHPGDCQVWLITTGTKGAERLALVDTGTGDDTAVILENVRREGFDPRNIEYVLLTHAHRDHAGGCAALKKELPAVKIVTSKVEADLLETGTARELGLNLLGYADNERDTALPPCAVDTVLSDGQLLRFGDVTVRAVVVPGHNPGCVCYLAEVDSRRALFSGDTVNCGGYISVGNWPGSDLNAYEKHIGKLSGLGVDALFPSHHLFTLSGGQEHIDKAVQSFDGLWPPPQIHTLLQ